MSGYVFAVTLSAAVVAFLFYLLRTRRLREKYVGLWLFLALAVVVLSIFPQLAVWLARLVGVQTPSNLVFAGAFVVLLAVCIHLSVAVSSLEERTRTLAEELALTRLDMETAADGQGETEPRGH